MDFKRLHYFVTLSEELNMRRAAERLGVSQPALSLQINALESELGLDLIIRDRQRILALTEAGRSYVAQARRALGELHDTAQAARAVSRGRSAALRLGLCEEVSTRLLGDLIQRCRQQLPQLAFQYRELPPDELLQALARRDLDAALTYLPFRQPGFKTDTLWQESWLAAVPEDHALARTERISCADLVDSDLILRRSEENRASAEPIRAAFFRAGIVPRSSVSAARRSMMLTLAMTGFGITFVPASLHVLHIPGLKLIPMDCEPMTVVLAYPSSIESEPLAQFLGTALQS